MNHKNLNLQSPMEAGESLAQRARAMRLHKGWTRQTLAKRAGVTESSLKRFENTGKASLELVLKIAHALGRLTEFNQVLVPPPAQSIEELEQRGTRPLRKRGKI
jgi:HTH-type transcriptional regulator/antitoxin HipB